MHLSRVATRPRPQSERGSGPLFSASICWGRARCRKSELANAHWAVGRKEVPDWALGSAGKGPETYMESPTSTSPPPPAEVKNSRVGKEARPADKNEAPKPEWHLGSTTSIFGPWPILRPRRACFPITIPKKGKVGKTDKNEAPKPECRLQSTTSIFGRLHFSKPKLHVYTAFSHNPQKAGRR